MAHLEDIQRIHRALAALGGNETDFDKALEKTGKTATCRPWSRQDFVERLQSYSSGTWFAKPEIISPMVCARHGWLNVSMDTLRCASCAQKLQFGFGGLGYDDTEEAAVNFARHLNIGHLASCPWRGSPSPEAFAYFPPAAASDLTAAFDARRSELANSSLETRSVVAPSCLTNALAASRDAGTAATDEHSSASSSSSSNTQASPAGAVEVTAATGASVESSQESTSQVAKTLSTDGDSIMALFGWQVATKPGHVSCALCGRCVSLDCDSNNTDPTSAAAADVPTIRATDTLVAEMNEKEGAEACDAGAPQPKRLRLKAPFDVEAAHRWFCPWVRADAAAPPSTASRTMATTTAKGVQGENQPATPGWQRVLKALLAAPPPLQGALTIPGSAQTQEKTSTSSVVSHAEARAALASARAVLRNI